jgi:hypothetical protein
MRLRVRSARGPRICVKEEEGLLFWRRNSPCPQPKMTPCFLTASTIPTHSSIDVAIGFSHKISYPCSANTLTASACPRSIIAMMTASATFPREASSFQSLKTRSEGMECRLARVDRRVGRGSARATNRHVDGFREM